MAQTIQNSTLRFISDYLDIVCVLINKYQCPSMKDIENGREIAMKMREMFTTGNRLQVGVSAFPVPQYSIPRNGTHNKVLFFSFISTWQDF